MACALTIDVTLGCDDSQGGVEKIYVTTFANVTATASDASGEVTGITLSGGTRFFIYNLPMGVADASEQGAHSRENGTSFFEQTVNAVVNEISKNRRTEINALQQGLWLVITKDKNGIYRLFGKNNGLICNVQTVTGVAMGDRNGYNLVFTGQEQLSAPVVSSGLIATITA